MNYIPYNAQNNLQKIRCTNCNQYGHHIRHCNQPISSYGLIAFRITDPAWNQAYNLGKSLAAMPIDKIQFLMIQRRNTYGFVEIIRGKYKLNDSAYIRSIISETTIQEQEDLLLKDFDTLWREMWGIENKNYKHDFEISKEKFNKLLQGVEDHITRQKYTLAQLISENRTHWQTAEWGFPKGKPNTYESPIDTAQREFVEETGLECDDFNIIQNIHPFQEMFYGTNNIQYKHIYYLAYIPSSVKVSLKKDNEIMMREIGDIKWFYYSEALNKIRDYNKEKKDLLIQVHSVLQKYAPLLIGPVDEKNLNLGTNSYSEDEYHNRGSQAVGKNAANNTKTYAEAVCDDAVK